MAGGLNSLYIKSVKLSSKGLQGVGDLEEKSSNFWQMLSVAIMTLPYLGTIALITMPTLTRNVENANKRTGS